MHVLSNVFMWSLTVRYTLNPSFVYMSILPYTHSPDISLSIESMNNFVIIIIIIVVINIIIFIIITPSSLPSTGMIPV